MTDQEAINYAFEWERAHQKRRIYRPAGDDCLAASDEHSTIVRSICSRAIIEMLADLGRKLKKREKSGAADIRDVVDKIRAEHRWHLGHNHSFLVDAYIQGKIVFSGERRDRYRAMQVLLRNLEKLGHAPLGFVACPWTGERLDEEVTLD
jgi:hypothetical protein